MYSVSNMKYVNKGKVVDKTELIDLNGFLMASKNKVFKIQGENIRKIRVVDKQWAHPLASKKGLQKYRHLLSVLTEYLIDDDDSGESCREALNEIEKFRIEIKNKYRLFLTRQELEAMKNKLLLLQKEAQQKLMIIQNQYYEQERDNKRSR
jgi:hypothetical protein